MTCMLALHKPKHSIKLFLSSRRILEANDFCELLHVMVTSAHSSHTHLCKAIQNEEENEPLVQSYAIEAPLFITQQRCKTRPVVRITG